MGREGSYRKIGDGLDDLMRRLDAGGAGLRKSRAAMAWEDVAGPSIGAHCTGVFVRDDEMIVYVDSPVWATELQAISEQFRVAVNERLGQETVSGMRFLVTKRPHAPRPTPSAGATADTRTTRGTEHTTISDADRDRIEQDVVGIENPTLREAVLRARIAEFLWKKGDEDLK